MSARLFAGLSCLAASAALLAGCGAREHVDARAGGAGLMRNLLVGACVEVQASEELLLAAARARAAELDPQHTGWSARFDAGAPDAARIRIGTLADPATRALVERLGVRTGTRGAGAFFAVDELEFSGAEDALAACFEDPERPGLPLTIYWGNDAEHLARLVRHELVAGWKPSFSAWRGARLALHGPLALDGRIDLAHLERPLAARAEVELERSLSALPARADGLWGMLQSGADPARVERCLSELAHARENVRAWAAPELPTLELLVLARAEDFTRACGAAEPAFLDPLARRVTVCLAPGLPGDGGAAAARAALRELLGECSQPWLEDGAAVDAAGAWWGEPLERWLARLESRGLVPPLARVCDARADRELSPHLVVPLRAALFRFLRETRSADELRALWGGTRTLAIDAALESAFAAALHARVAAASAELERTPRRAFAAVGADGRLGWRGLESERSRGAGWSSEAGRGAIAAVAELGANAYAVRASCIAREHPAALPDALRATHFGTREGDLELVAALTAAREQHLATLLDLDVLASPGSIEDGAWLRTRPADWQRFFDTRRAALVHAALLAELARADALSIGCGLEAVTRDQIEGRKGTQADLEAKRRGWADAIGAARRAFDGALAYVSDSYSELGLVLFAKDVDALGLRLDEHLAPAGARGAVGAREDLLRRMQAAFALVTREAAAEHKPWFLARTACQPSTRVAGRPSLGAGAVDPDAQRAELETLGSALVRLPRESRPAALFLWRYPSDPAEEPLDPCDPLLARPALVEALRQLWRVL